MPRVYPEDVEPTQTQAKMPCSELRDDLKLCMLNSDCIKIRKKKAMECFKTDDVPDECRQLRTLLFECKRSLLDNRLRFRGRKDY